MSSPLQKKTAWIMGAPLLVAVAVLGLGGCSSPSTSTTSEGAAVSSPSATAADDAADDDDMDDVDDSDDAAAIGDASASTFDTATAIVDAFVAAGGVCDNPVDSKLSLATSSIDCVGSSKNMQTIAVFATPDEARSWFEAQKAVRVTETTSYLLGANWAMFTDGTGSNSARKLGVRDETIEMR